MNYRRVNTLTGWGAFAIALITYLLTMAPTASFWDCGEFIACANELQVPHPPGAPFFLLIGRIFAMLAMGNVEAIPVMLNFMSALASAFTVLFTFWITTHLAVKMLLKTGEPQTRGQLVAVMAAGLVAALANTFADSFWFNAVEAEVYALSSFFTAVVVWLMFKWEERADEPGNERWIILIAYLMGLSIGVHLLNLLTVPALAFIYYFRKFKPTPVGLVATALISVAILGVIQTGIILNTFDLAWAFERFFIGTQYPNGVAKGGLGLPVGSGVVTFFVLLFGAIVGGVLYTIRQKLLVWNTALLGIVVIFIGFSSYLMIPIRSKANPPIDENNPENTQTFLSYMKREQYGNRPLLRGPLYNANPVALQSDGIEYVLRDGDTRYTELGEKKTYKYSPRDIKFFPRMYEKSRYDTGPHGYKNYVRNKGADPNDPNDDKPTALENLRFFFGYQINHMYWRYFLWNFAGREGDTQDQAWESGLRIDRTAKMPDFMKTDPGKNHYFLLPLLLGLIGLFWQSLRRSTDAGVVALLFFFTGLAIIIYLNQYPAQPRERDYSFAGSIQTFAIWIGLGVIAIYDWLKSLLKDNAAYLAAALGILPMIVMGAQNWGDHSRAGNYVAPDSAYNLLNSLAPNAVVFTNGDNDTFPLWYLQEVEGVRTDVRVLCLSYVNTDWYIDQMKQQVNDSPPLPITLKDYVGQARQSTSFGDRTELSINFPANPDQLIGSGIVAEADRQYIQSPMAWTVKTRGPRGSKYLELKDMLILNLLENVAKEGWERPIYFANTVAPNSFIGLDANLRQEGLAYRILPFRRRDINDPYDPFAGSLDLAKMDTALTQTFRYRGLDQPGVYYDENIRRMLANYYNTFYRLAAGYQERSNKLRQEATALKREAEQGLMTPELEERIAGIEREAARMKTRALEVMDVAGEKFPYTAAAPDPYMLVRSGEMYAQLGQADKAQEYFDYVEKTALGTLEYYSETGQFFPKGREYYFPLQMIQQYYVRSGNQERANQLTVALGNIDPELINMQ
ncbi:MAG: DUF2723 domain-containing protein [Bacteroidia bacterium]